MREKGGSGTREEVGTQAREERRSMWGAGGLVGSGAGEAGLSAVPLW